MQSCRGEIHVTLRKLLPEPLTYKLCCNSGEFVHRYACYAGKHMHGFYSCQSYGRPSQRERPAKLLCGSNLPVFFIFLHAWDYLENPHKTIEYHLPIPSDRSIQVHDSLTHPKVSGSTVWLCGIPQNLTFVTYHLGN